MFMIIAILSACTETPSDITDTDATETNKETTDTSTDDVGPSLSIIKNGISQFTIIYPPHNNGLYKSAEKLAMKIYSVHDVMIDTIRQDNVEYSPDTFEILVGLTDRPESIAEYERLERTGEYICEMSGNKLVIIGATDDATEKAINYFMIGYLSSKITKGELVYNAKSDCHFKSDYKINILTCAGNDLRDYKIVYPKNSTKGEYYAALNLRYHFFSRVGIDVEVIDDSVAPTGNEIVIGNTSREKTPAVDTGKFSVNITDDNIYVSANDFFGFLDADAYVVGELISTKSEDDVLKNGFSYTGDAQQNPVNESSYRVIFNNIWGLLGTDDSTPYANRDEYTAAFYLAYQPDVIALNELWDGYRAGGSLPSILTRNGYTEVDISQFHDKSNTNVLPIFYRADKLKLVDSKYVHYQWYADDTTNELVQADDSKGVTIAVFEGLDENGNGNGERFIICNTHFTSNIKSKTHGYNSRMLNIDVCMEELKPFVEKYPDASVLLGCDYNSTATSDECKKLMEEYGFVNCHDTAEVADNQCSSHGYPTYNKSLGYYTSGNANLNDTYKNSIDHIFQLGDTIDAKVFDTLTTKYTIIFSDHSPLLLDFNVIA